MHRDSEKPDTETANLRLYLDESGGEDPGTPHSVLGGMLIYKGASDLFENAWKRMLADHDIAGGLHMREFGRPHGRLAHLSDCRRELFTEACNLIRKYRAMIMASTLSNDEYRSCIPEIVRKSYSVYAMGFSLMVVMNHKLAEFNNYADPIPIIMDSGNPKKGHVITAHSFMQKRVQRVSCLHLGSLTFDNDNVSGLLQAADLVAWGTRRKVSSVPFDRGFSPILDLLSSDERYRTEVPWRRQWLEGLGDNLAELIASGEGFEEPTDENLEEFRV